METILKIRDICKGHHSCYDNCPFHVDHECVLGIPPANWSDEDLYLISKALKGEEAYQGAEIYDKDTVAWMFRELQLEIKEKVDNRDFMTKKIQEIIQSEEIKPDDDLQSGYNLCLVDICNSIQQKIDALKGDKETEKYTQARLEFIRRNSIYGLNFGKDYERLEQEFHCGVEESGFHAYNCNDCPNKCEEWHQWEKEIEKEAENDKDN